MVFLDESVCNVLSCEKVMFLVGCSINFIGAQDDYKTLNIL